MRVAENAPAYVIRRLWWELARQLQSSDPIEYELALAKLEGLERAPTRAVATILERRLASPDDWVRERTAMALAELPTPGAMLKTLAKALRDPLAAVRSYVCETLGKNAAPGDAQRLLRRMLADKSDEVRSTALSALSRLGACPSLPTLRRLARDESSLVRLAAIEIIQQRIMAPGEAARGPTRLLLETQLQAETDGVVRCAILEALYMSGRNDATLDAIVALCRARRGLVRWRAYDTLGRLGTFAKARAIENALRAARRSEPDRALRRHAQHILMRLQRAH